MKLDTKLKPKEIPPCGVSLGGRDGYIFIRDSDWEDRLSNRPAEYNFATCGVDHFDCQRRCERCMRAVGAIW